MNQCECGLCETVPHDSDCAVHNEPATPNGDCDCKGEWSELSEVTRDVMKEMGGFGPTVGFDAKMIKGYIGEDQEGQCYMGPEELREQACAMNEVADWLERRASITQPTKD